MNFIDRLSIATGIKLQAILHESLVKGWYTLRLCDGGKYGRLLQMAIVGLNPRPATESVEQ